MTFMHFGQTELVLSTCGPEQFPCDSGQCVPQDRRCNRKPDCSDKTDERGCEIVPHLSKHTQEVPPPPTTGDNFVLQLSLEITSVRTFDLVGFRIELDMIFRMEWRDSRLTFYNLRDDINRIEASLNRMDSCMFESCL